VSALLDMFDDDLSEAILPTLLPSSLLSELQYRSSLESWQAICSGDEAESSDRGARLLETLITSNTVPSADSARFYDICMSLFPTQSKSGDQGSWTLFVSARRRPLFTNECSVCMYRRISQSET
jgi:hypothetical protein